MQNQLHYLQGRFSAFSPFAETRLIGVSDLAFALFVAVCHGLKVIEVPDGERTRHHIATSVTMPNSDYVAVKGWKIDSDTMNWENRESAERE